MNLSPPQIITTTKQLTHLATELAQSPAIGVDTESNSAFAYYEQVCLIQVSTAHMDYIIDPLMVGDLAPLGEIFANDGVEKIFHSAEYDLKCLKRDYHFEFVNLFDTMWAARMLGWSREGLSSILREHFAVRTDKRYQRYNWHSRPLAREAIRYAQLDTHYLIPLHDLQKQALAAQGKMPEAMDIFAEVAATPAGARRDYQDAAVWQVPGAGNFAPETRAILHRLVCWREREAARRDRPPFMIFNNETLITIAERAPAKMDELRRIRGIKEHHLARYGEALLRTVARGQHTRPPSPPPNKNSDAGTRRRYEQLQAWRRNVATRREIHPAVVMSKDVLWVIAQRNPRTLEQLGHIEGIGAWRLQKYGAEILRVTRET